MPLYEYTCTTCQSEFELLLLGDDKPKCPECGGKKLHKHFSVPAAHTRRGAALPVCETPSSFGGCGLPQCGMGGCQMD
jgi:putative FmdB family regulatory protein